MIIIPLSLNELVSTKNHHSTIMGTHWAFREGAIRDSVSSHDIIESCLIVRAVTQGSSALSTPVFIYIKVESFTYFFLPSYLLDFVLDGQLDTAEAGSVVGAWWTLVHVTIQYGLHFLRVSTKVQNTYYKVLTLHGQLTVVVLHRMGIVGESKHWKMIRREKQIEWTAKLTKSVQSSSFKIMWPSNGLMQDCNITNTTILEGQVMFRYSFDLCTFVLLKSLRTRCRTTIGSFRDGKKIWCVFFHLSCLLKEIDHKLVFACILWKTALQSNL